MEHGMSESSSMASQQPHDHVNVHAHTEIRDTPAVYRSLSVSRLSTCVCASVLRSIYLSVCFVIFGI